MMSDQKGQEESHAVPQQSSLRWLEWPRARIAIVAVTLVVGLVLISTSSRLALAGSVLVGLALIVPTSTSFVYEHIWSLLVSKLIRRNEGELYVPPLEFDTGDNPLNVQFSVIRITGGPQGETSIPVISSDETDTIYLTLSPAHGINYEPGPRRKSWDEDIATIVDGLHKLDVDNVAMLRLQIPANPEPNVAHLGNRCHVSEDYSEKDILRLENLGEANDLIFRDAVEPVQLLAIRVKRSWAWGQKKAPTLLSMEEFMQTEISTVLMAAMGEFENVGIVSSLATANLITYYLRSTLDPSSAALTQENFQEDAAENKDLLESSTWQRGPWPDHVYATKTELQLDGTFHRTLQVRGFGRIQSVAPGYFDDLLSLHGGGWISHSLVSRREKMATQRFFLQMRRDWMADNANSAGGNTRYRKERNRQEAEEQLAEAELTNHEASRFGSFVRISADSVPDLDRLTREVEQQYARAGVNLACVRGESRQLPALLLSMGLSAGG